MIGRARERRALFHPGCHKNVSLAGCARPTFPTARLTAHFNGEKVIRALVLVISALSIVANTSALADAAADQTGANPFARIGHIVVIYTENRSFDHVFGLFPGADGVADAKREQVDADGKPLPYLPFPFDRGAAPTQPNAPFLLEGALAGVETVDPTHDFYPEQEQIDGGLMDRFVEASNAGGLVMGYRDASKLQQWRLAREFTLADHFFHAAFGGL
jgi:phospholipase C